MNRRCLPGKSPETHRSIDVLLDIIKRTKNRDTFFSLYRIVIKVRLAVYLRVKTEDPEGYISFLFLMQFCDSCHIE